MVRCGAVPGGGTAPGFHGLRLVELVAALTARMRHMRVRPGAREGSCGAVRPRCCHAVALPLQVVTRFLELERLDGAEVNRAAATPCNAMQHHGEP